MNLNSALKFCVISLGLFTVSACEEDRTRPQSLVAAPQDGSQWPSIVASARNKVSTSPDKGEYRTALLSAIQSAEDYYISAGRRMLDEGDIASAEGVFSKGLLVVPESQALRSEMEDIKDKKKSNALMSQGRSSLKLGRNERAISQLEEALQYNPNNREALRLLNNAYGSTSIHTAPKPIRLKSSAPVTVNFRDADVKEAFLTLGKNFGVNIIFDAGLEDSEVTLYADRVSFDQAFKLMLKASGNHFRPMGQNSVLIYKDNAESRAANSDFHVRTFYLESAPAEQIRALIERVLDVQNVNANVENNSITLRATREKLALADRLIRSNDRGTAEVSLEVEILEVNRTKSENLGVEYGSQITISPPTLTRGQIRNGEASTALNSSVVTLPATSIKFFKQDVDARTLASPRIRTVSQKQATIHIGDRVPLRAATVLDSNGQTRTSFEYRDIGIKLEVTPKVLLDKTVEVNLNLEVSSLGQNLGTAEESAFSIGTRNVTTNMVLNDSETAIIGGLIRDEERATVQKVPGLGEIPLIGQLFQVRDGQGTRTDILLTLTPRIVKGWDIPSPADTEFYSGTGSRVSSENEFAFLDDGAPGGAVIRLDLSGTSSTAQPAKLSPVVAAPKVEGTTAPKPTISVKPKIGFSRAIYNVGLEGTQTIELTPSGLTDTLSGGFNIRFNKEIVNIASAKTTGGASADVSIDNATGLISILNMTASGDAALLSFEVEGKKAGLSYFLIENIDATHAGAAPEFGSAKIVAK